MSRGDREREKEIKKRERKKREREKRERADERSANPVQEQEEIKSIETNMSVAGRGEESDKKENNTLQMLQFKVMSKQR
jgi:hypothetical protein